jgi:putative two-component system response regulator
MNPTILLVDVPSPARDDWKAFLQNHKYDVYTAEDGDSALRQCLELQPDLVLLYAGLPDSDSIVLCRRMKKDPLNHFTPVILVNPSLTLSPADLARGQEAGAAEFWGTPASLWEGISRVQSLLRLNRYVDQQVKSVVLSLARSIESRSSLTEGHSDRLAEYAVQLGESLDLPDEDLQELRVASWLHDIGKVAVPDAVLFKPGPLNPEEIKIVRQHPLIGERICAPLKSLRRILPVIRHHHERMDGSGYPDGLRGNQIPLKARILQVADIYDALITARPYRSALSHSEALEILWGEARLGWVDASLVRKFSQISNSAQHFPVRGRSMLASYYTH